MNAFEPYIGAIKIAAALALAAALFGAGWVANGWRLEHEIASMQRDQAEAAAAANETARLIERARTKQLEEARNAATKRETALRADATAARGAADGLRNDIADLRRQLPGLAADACRDRADTLAQLFEQCTGDYRGMAETADRHASDKQTLIDAWPK